MSAFNSDFYFWCPECERLTGVYGPPGDDADKEKTACQNCDRIVQVPKWTNANIDFCLPCSLERGEYVIDSVVRDGKRRSIHWTGWGLLLALLISLVFPALILFYLPVWVIGRIFGRTELVLRCVRCQKHWLSNPRGIRPELLPTTPPSTWPEEVPSE